MFAPPQAGRGRVMGTLYLVATPIGNLEDISARAIRILGEVALIAAEDTRHTGKLLAHFGITTPMVSYHRHNERSRQEQLLAVLGEGDVALVSDAGMPGISDPGAALVRWAAEAGVPVSPVPGASALTAAVAAAGLADGPFITLGFLPRRGAERRVLIGKAGATGWPVVLSESPERLGATLEELAATWGERAVVVLRELTKLHEEVVRGTLASLAAEFRGRAARGEIVVVVGSGGSAEIGDESEIDELLAALRRSGLSASQAAREAAAASGLSRSALYERARRAGADPETAG